MVLAHEGCDDPWDMALFKIVGVVEDALQDGQAAERG